MAVARATPIMYIASILTLADCKACITILQGLAIRLHKVCTQCGVFPTNSVNPRYFLKNIFDVVEKCFDVGIKETVVPLYLIHSGETPTIEINALSDNVYKLSCSVM